MSQPKSTDDIISEMKQEFKDKWDNSPLPSAIPRFPPLPSQSGNGYHLGQQDNSNGSSCSRTTDAPATGSVAKFLFQMVVCIDTRNGEQWIEQYRSFPTKDSDLKKRGFMGGSRTKKDKSAVQPEETKSAIVGEETI